MSRTSLRRQLFHKNLDLLLQSGGLDTVEEEASHRNTEYYKPEPVTDLDAPVDANQCMESGDSADQALLYRSPIYRPKHVQNIEKPAASGSSRPISEYDQCSTPYFEPWESKASGPVLYPGTPYTEIDDNIANTESASRTSKCKPAQMMFQFPAPASSVNKTHSLPFSPIHRTSVRAQFKGVEGCSTCEDDIRALPMSPALFMSQTTSTPGPTSVAMETPTCHSILENNNSIFNFSECNMCRICHEDGGTEKLVSPCHCAGTMGMLHVSCLEKWLGSSNTTKCEICQFQFIVQKKPRPLTWYLKEPTLIEDRKWMVRAAVLLLVLGLFVFTICIVCLVFARQLTVQEQHGPSSVLIVLAICSLVLYCIWMFVAVRRMRRQITIWHNEHHIIQIKQRQGCHGDTSNRIFRRFPVKLPSARQKSQSKKPAVNNLIPSSFISCSLESYKAAMINPVTPSEPLLQDANNNDITSLDETSPSVISLDELIGECVSYYQPPECGTTSVLSADSDIPVDDTCIPADSGVDGSLEKSSDDDKTGITVEDARTLANTPGAESSLERPHGDSKTGITLEDTHTLANIPEAKSSLGKSYDISMTGMGDTNRLSHFMARLLRHDAISRGLDVTPEGYVDIDDVLSQPEAKRFSQSDVKRVVDNDNKGRFKIRIRDGVTQIKATQAHSMQLESAEAEMTPIQHHLDARVVLHGTRKANWPSIKASGLSRRNRRHIHFAEGERVKSGFPPNCDMVIELNLELALKDGLKFYKSENGVILCAGNRDGAIPAKYFKRAYDLHTHDPID